MICVVLLLTPAEYERIHLPMSNTKNTTPRPNRYTIQIQLRANSVEEAEQTAEKYRAKSKVITARVERMNAGYKLVVERVTHLNDTATKIPAAACGRCGGWTSRGGCSQHRNDQAPTEDNMFRTGCFCKLNDPKRAPHGGEYVAAVELAAAAEARARRFMGEEY